jgi:hypothetical protein
MLKQVKDSLKNSTIQTMQAIDSTLEVKLQTQDSIIQAMQYQMEQCCESSDDKMSTNSNHSQKAINDSLIKEIETIRKEMKLFQQSLEQCCFNYEQNTSVVNSVTKNNSSDKETALLEQNIPNTFNESTSIKYYIPANVKTAIITIKTIDGKELKRFVIEEKGFGQIIISGGTFANGTYIYEMITDNKLVGSKKMVLTK